MSTAPASSVSESPQEQLAFDRAQLKHAFAQFSRLSREILQSYTMLEQNVEHLTDKLEIVSRDRLLALQEKQILAARLQGLLRVLPCAVVVLDNRGRVENFNERAQTLLPAIRKGMSWASLVADTFVQREATAIEAKTKQGRFLHVATCPLDEHHGQLVVLTDVTDMRQLQIQVARNRRLAALGKAVASLSHQLKTPLSTAIIYAKHLRSTELSLALRLEMTKKLEQSLQRMNAYINDLLMFTRGGRENAEPICLVGALSDWHRQWQEYAQLRAIHLALELPQKEVVVLANPKALHEAISNIVMNAFEAAIESATPKVCLTIETSTEFEQVLIRIEDNGPGIAQNLEDEIFDPFVSSKTQGTGLGLAITHSVISSIGGTVEASRSPLGGACFVVRLPLVRDLHAEVMRPDSKTGE